MRSDGDELRPVLAISRLEAQLVGGRLLEPGVRVVLVASTGAKSPSWPITFQAMFHDKR